MNFKKAILIAGGSGSRLNPITNQISKQLLPIYDKPMIYYPLSILMLLKIRDIQIITTIESNTYYKSLLGNGKRFGIQITYNIQKSPQGIAHAIKISKDFIDKKNVCVILGDNIFYGQSLIENIKNGIVQNNGATIFGYYMKNPNESVNEIFPKGAGRKISKAMQKGIEPQGNIKKVLDVAKNQQSKKIGGTLVDLTTANLMTQVWNKVNDSSKEKMNKMNAKQLTNLILRIWKGVGTPRV